MPTVLKRVEKSCHLPTPGRAEAGGGRTSLWFARSRRRLLLCSDDTAAGEVAKGRRNKAAAVRAGGGTAEVERRKAVGGGVTDIKGELFSLFSSGVAEKCSWPRSPAEQGSKSSDFGIHIPSCREQN
jgi:hypothetical protein